MADQDPYGAIKFGEFRKYMQNKKAKLKEQEKAVHEPSAEPCVPIFEGCSIHINGYTIPSRTELRRLIIQHGGDFQHYLKKQQVTHIVASTLTNAKINELRAYKVVKPQWIVDSVNAKQLLPWSSYRVIANESAQKELPFAAAASESSKAPPSPPSPLDNVKDTNALKEQNRFSPKGEELNAALLSNQWNRQTSTVNPDFIKKYYQSSRLHHLSTWKAELKEIVRNMEQKFPAGSDPNGSRKRKRVDGLRVVMHVDFDCFFASVGIKDRPHLKDKPVAVSHGKGLKDTSSSDIASCNYIARSFGVHNGMHIGTAKKLCPDLQVIPYEFDKYKAISEIFYEILFQYADEIQAVSVDEALMEVASYVTEPNTGQEEALATQIRDDIRKRTGCEASIGIGPNILFAKLATKKAKPCGQFYCRKEEAESIIKDHDVSALPGVGYVLRSKLNDMGIRTIGDLSKANLSELSTKFGTKTGRMLHDYSRGIDDRPLITNQPRQSVSAEVNWGVRFETDQQAKSFLIGLSEEVSNRLRNIDRRGKSITLKLLRRRADAGEAEKYLGCGECDSYSKSITLDNYTDDASIINKHAYQLLRSLNIPTADIRGVGIQIQKLDQSETHRPSASQATLEFTARPQQSGSPEREPQTPTTTETEKLPMKVDQQVFTELPTDIQSHLSKNYDLQFIQEQQQTTQQLEALPDIGNSPLSKEAAESESHVNDHHAPPSSLLSSLAGLPPWSQLDPTSLLALPNTMQKQVLEAYSKVDKKPKSRGTSRLISASPESPRRSRPTSVATTSTVLGSPRNRSKRGTVTEKKAGITLTQMFPPSPNRRYPRDDIKDSPTDKNDHADEVPWDLDIWNELPTEIRRELLADRRLEKERKKQDQVNQQFRQARHNKLLNNAAPVLDIPQRREPILMGKSRLEDIRELLRQWMDSFPEAPEPEDVETVTKYIQELVQEKDIEKAQLVIMYLDYLVKQRQLGKAWQDHAQHIHQCASMTARDIFQCSMRF
ncbi:uncharacterized protein BYT42DRAFT_359890 [Radiomyces spectabilis]|uniref:uncharacterized protein n=1 Tax=Radiomyces spectabilis TaxID=64574 RepID=UPI00221E3F95|nr:uncharacterized protein BYT42DRAFT_359890 [Radiomyces spectabilis]KAI8377857.1 hypothetical protein BYT42DRAFT_359890 [Radiomyces spectabilis]